MTIIDLKTAAQQIKAAYDAKHRRGERSPFFFITGAGLSAPSVPLAAEIIKHCQERAIELYKKSPPPASASALESYSHWFAAAYPNPDERRIYLQDLIAGKAITPANLRLAHLLLDHDHAPADLVVTTNFDDLLSRALLLFGKQHVLCDHPSTIGRIETERGSDVKIVHVHGSYWFYDCCNLKDEIAARAQRSANLPFDMAAFLDHVLLRHSPLVLGYGGWEGDGVMSALRRRLYHGEQPQALGYNVYWFVYDRQQIAALPEWLRQHPNVSFVAKPEPVRPAEPEAEAFATSAGEKMAAGRLATAPPRDWEREPRDLVLPAQEALDELIRVFDLQAPELFRDTLGFFITSLQKALPSGQPADAQPDIYLIRSKLARLAWAQQKLAEMEQALDAAMEKVRDALRRAQYRQALELAGEIALRDLSEAQRLELMRLLWDAAEALNDNSEEELAGYERIAAIAELLPEPTDETQLLLARALLRKGYVLRQLNRHEEALAAYDQVLARFGEATEPALREQVAWALVNKGYILGELNRREEALAAYDQVLARFGEATELPLRERVARALVGKGNRLSELNRHEEALAAYDQVLARFGEATELPLREHVAWALVNKGYILGELNRREEALAAYDQVLARFGEATELALREQVARALVNKGNRLGELNRREEALAAYDQVLARFGEATELELREQVAMALMNKGVTLNQLNRHEEALAAYDQVLIRFGEATELPLRELVARALNGLGFQLLCQAKSLWAAGEEEKAKQHLLLAEEKITASLARRPEYAIALGNHGYIKFLLGEKDQARALLIQAISLGGEEVRQGELEDATIHPLPQDEEFRSLVLSIPLPEKQAGT